MLSNVLLALLLLVADVRPIKPTIEVDLIELNHVHDTQSGRFKFTQIILWEWSHDYRRYHVVMWWIPDRITNDINGTTATNNGVMYQAFFVRETWTLGDPEVENRKVFDCKFRRLY